jgi:hypothetical protein
LWVQKAAHELVLLFSLAAGRLLSHNVTPVVPKQAAMFCPGVPNGKSRLPDGDTSRDK